jgi:hypothetical protein
VKDNKVDLTEEMTAEVAVVETEEVVVKAETVVVAKAEEDNNKSKIRIVT